MFIFFLGGGVEDVTDGEISMSTLSSMILFYMHTSHLNTSLCGVYMQTLCRINNGQLKRATNLFEREYEQQKAREIELGHEGVCDKHLKLCRTLYIYKPKSLRFLSILIIKCRLFTSIGINGCGSIVVFFFVAFNFFMMVFHVLIFSSLLYNGMGGHRSCGNKNS